jgi:hypothetical protein
MAVVENINGVKSEKCREKYDHIFLNILPGIFKQRNAFAHGHFHVFKKVLWSYAWKMLDEMSQIYDNCQRT